MTGFAAGALIAAVFSSSSAPQSAPATTEVIAEVRVHGNHVTPDAEIVKLAGIEIGASVATDSIEKFRAALRKTGRFDDVDVLKRYASIADASQITIVIIVNEGPVRIEFPSGPGDAPPRVVRRRGWRNLMFLPILDGEDGYGLTYGLTTSLAKVVGERSRLSMPLTWGGTRQARVEVEKNFATGPLSRIEFGAAVQRQKNPAFEIDDDRQRLWVRAERAFQYVRFGATAGWQQVKFAGSRDTFRSIGADVTLDTRIDPTFPRNAVLATASWERLNFEDDGGSLDRTHLEARGYLGLIRQTVLAVSVIRDGANAAQPRYLQPMLGGWSNLRGFEAGAFVNDTVMTGTAELLIPVTTALSLARIGVSVFVDTGAAYGHGQRFRDQTRKTGLGGSVWFSATVFRLSLSVAHGRGAGTRVNFGGGLTF